MTSWYTESMHNYLCRVTRKQDGSSNKCISVYMSILSPGDKCYSIYKSTSKSTAAYVYAAPVYSSTKSVQKLYSLTEMVKIQNFSSFSILSFFLSFFLLNSSFNCKQSKNKFSLLLLKCLY